MTEKPHEIPYGDRGVRGNSCSYILTWLRKFLEEVDPSTGKTEHLPMFCMREIEQRTVECLYWINKNQSVMDSKQRDLQWANVLVLEDLFFALIKGDERLREIPVLSPLLATDILICTKFDFQDATACEFHERQGNQANCALGHATHRAQVIFDVARSFLGIDETEGHLGLRRSMKNTTKGTHVQIVSVPNGFGVVRACGSVAAHPAEAVGTAASWNDIPKERGASASPPGEGAVRLRPVGGDVAAGHPTGDSGSSDPSRRRPSPPPDDLRENGVGNGWTQVQAGRRRGNGRGQRNGGGRDNFDMGNIRDGLP